MRYACARIAILSFLPSVVLALAPHEVLVLSNARSPDSMDLAKEYIALRHIPEINHVRIPLPETMTGSPARITPAQFISVIWDPAVRIARERGIERQILAWVYSVDFPILVETEPKMSIQGITFLRGQVPDSEDIRRGFYASPLFAGPNNPVFEPYLSQTFDSYRDWLGDDMPLPSMMLGYTGPRGNTLTEVRDCLRGGAASDGLAPSGTVYFVTGDDVRSTCRQWQYPKAVSELAARNVRAVITDKFPASRGDVIGLMTGTPTVDPRRCTYRPGAMAEHFTSAAAIFHSRNQTKLSAWIKAGATASSGTVTEPYSIWTKIPNARFYVHYSAGCTMIESFFQSIRCPLQILLVGDPLAAPWRPWTRLEIEGVPEDEVSGAIRLTASAGPMEHSRYGRFQFLVDGKIVEEGRELDLPAGALPDGAHRVRVVARRSGMLRIPVMREVSIEVRTAGVKEEQTP